MGDRVTWSKQYGKMVGRNSMIIMCSSGSAKMCDKVSTSSLFHNNYRVPTVTNDDDVCKHAFHEVFISQWLLVHDGCPTC